VGWGWLHHRLVSPGEFFVSDLEDNSGAVVNPAIVDSWGEKLSHEGCLSIPGAFLEVPRFDRVTLSGLDLDGNQLHFEVVGTMAAMFQHELDHLNGVLLLDRADPDQARRARRQLRLAALVA